MKQKDIAALAGVSRGTVDRVINNRGNVKPEIEQQIRKLLQEVEYRPNKAGKALAAIRNPIKIGVILASEGNPFFDDVLTGIRAAAAEYGDFGLEVLLKTARGYDVAEQLRLIRGLREAGINGLAIAPINDPAVVAAINEASEAGIKVISLNQDVIGSKRICYIGSDYNKCGEIAAGLLGLLREDAKVAIITGSRRMMGHDQRIRGFAHVAEQRYPRMQIVAVAENNDDEEQSYQAVKKILTGGVDVNAFFFAAAGIAGGIRAVRDTVGAPMLTITVDNTPEICRLLKEGWIKATIGQQPISQGYRAIETFYKILANGEEPAGEFLYVNNEIYIRENV